MHTSPGAFTFFLVVVDINRRHFTMFDSMTRPHQDRRYARVSQNLSHFLSLKLGVRRGLNFTHDIRQDLPRQTNGSDCGIFTCRYIYGLITGTGFLFDNRTSDVRRWLAQFILDEATSQADTTRGNIQIYEPPVPDPNTTMAVSYLREYCGVSIPDVFHVSHSLDCKHNCSVIGPRVRIAFTEVIEPQEPLSKIIDLTCYESLESSNDSHSPSIPLQQTIANTDSESNGESEFAYQPKLDMGVLDKELGLQRENGKEHRENNGSHMISSCQTPGFMFMRVI